MTLVYLVAGEASGDVLGARLMAAMRRARPELRFAGIGGTRMAELGLHSLFPMHDLAVMGLVEVLPKLRLLRRRLAETAADIAAQTPDVIVTIDAPGFTLRLLRRIAPLGIPRIHYVAPQIWAWRESRDKHYPGLWHDMLCLLPFEPEFFARHNLPASFVGHPVLESGANTGNAARFRDTHGLSPTDRVLILMPGSRRGEINRLLPIYQQTIRELHATIPDLRPVLVAAPGAEPALREAAADWQPSPIIVTNLAEKHDSYAAASAALTKSGTSSLELALAGIPMAVTYRVNPVTAAIFRHITPLRFVSLVNLLPDRQIVPELLQHDCNPKKLAETLGKLLAPNSAEAKTQRTEFQAILATLAPPSGTPSDAAAIAVLRALP